MMNSVAEIVLEDAYFSHTQKHVFRATDCAPCTYTILINRLRLFDESKLRGYASLLADHRSREQIPRFLSNAERQNCVAPLGYQCHAAHLCCHLLCDATHRFDGHTCHPPPCAA